MRVELEPGVAFPSHTHPGEEIIYVLEGAWEYMLEGKPVTVKAGEVLFVPAGTIHSARNVGTGNAAELATYIVEKDSRSSRPPSERPRAILRRSRAEEEHACDGAAMREPRTERSRSMTSWTRHRPNRRRFLADGPR